MKAWIDKNGELGPDANTRHVRVEWERDPQRDTAFAAPGSPDAEPSFFEDFGSETEARAACADVVAEIVEVIDGPAPQKMEAVEPDRPDYQPEVQRVSRPS